MVKIATPVSNHDIIRKHYGLLQSQDQDFLQNFVKEVENLLGAELHKAMAFTAELDPETRERRLLWRLSPQKDRIWTQWVEISRPISANTSFNLKASNEGSYRGPQTVSGSQLKRAFLDLVMERLPAEPMPDGCAEDRPTTQA